VRHSIANLHTPPVLITLNISTPDPDEFNIEAPAYIRKAKHESTEVLLVPVPHLSSFLPKLMLLHFPSLALLSAWHEINMWQTHLNIGC
jgi:hypothetical protein